MGTELVIYVFGDIIAIIGGTPGKRIPQGLFDVIRQTLHFTFPPSNQSSFYVFGVLGDSTLAEPRFFAHENRVHSMFLNLL